MNVADWGSIMGTATWLTSRNKDASKKFFVAIGIVVFDFELFIGDLFASLS